MSEMSHFHCERCGREMVERTLRTLTRTRPQVFDVTKGARHYGPGGGYAGFAGRDGTRAFGSGKFTDEGLVDEVAGLSDVDAAGLLVTLPELERSVARLRLDQPDASLAGLAGQLEISRPRVQRALERIELAASHTGSGR